MAIEQPPEAVLFPASTRGNITISERSLGFSVGDDVALKVGMDDDTLRWLTTRLIELCNARGVKLLP